MPDPEIWYRYDDPWTEGEAPFLSEYPVQRHTAKCVVLDIGRDVFVRKDTHKRYAYPTKELALASYIIRKTRQIAHASATVRSATANLETAQKVQRGEVIETPVKFAFWNEDGA